MSEFFFSISVIGKNLRTFLLLLSFSNNFISGVEGIGKKSTDDQIRLRDTLLITNQMWYQYILTSK